MVIKNKDFIEIEFTGRIKDGEIFDSNIKQDLEKTELKLPAKPLIFCVGERMFLESIDDFLIGKEPGIYEIELTPEKAFGKRDTKLIKIIPLNVFRQQKVSPQPGMIFNFDGQIAKILSVSGGRVITDFNSPLAGKTVNYKIKVKRIVNDINEKTNALIEFFLKKEIPFEIKDKKLIVKTEKNISQFLNLFKDKFKELLDLELEIKEPDKKTDLEKSKENKKDLSKKLESKYSEVENKNN